GSSAAASTSSRSWSRTSQVCWRGGPAAFSPAARTYTPSRGGRARPPAAPPPPRTTPTPDGAAHPIDQVTKQLHKLVNVLKIRDMEPEETVAREMALFKVSAAVENRAEIIQFAETFRAKIVDVARRTITIEITGSADKIEAFERMIRPHGLVEMVRTGEIAIARGHE